MADFPPEWCANVEDVRRYLQVYGGVLDRELRARAEVHLQRLLDEGTPDLVNPHQNLNFLDANTVQCVLEQLEAESAAPFLPINEINGLEDCFDRLTIWKVSTFTPMKIRMVSAYQNNLTYRAQTSPWKVPK